MTSITLKTENKNLYYNLIRCKEVFAKIQHDFKMRILNE